MSISRLLTYEEVSRILGLSIPAVKELRRNGSLPYIRVSERVIRFQEQDIIQFLAERHVDV